MDKQMLIDKLSFEIGILKNEFYGQDGNIPELWFFKQAECIMELADELRYEFNPLQPWILSFPDGGEEKIFIEMLPTREQVHRALTNIYWQEQYPHDKVDLAMEFADGKLCEIHIDELDLTPNF
jgi:hypothetical protein